MCRHSFIVVLLCLVFPFALLLGQDIYDYSEEEISMSGIVDSIRLGIRAKSIQSIDELEDFAARSDLEGTPFALGTKHLIYGIWYNQNGNDELALTEISAAQNLFENCCYYSREHAHSLRYYGYILNNVGLLNFDTIVFRKVSVQMKKAVEIAEVVQDTFQMIKALGLLADHNFYSAYRIKNYSKALSYYQAVDSLLTQENQSYFAADNALGKANVYGMLNNTELEQYYFDQAQQLAINDSFYDVLFALYNDKAERFRLAQNDQKALEYLLQGYDYVLKSGNKEFISRSDRQLWWTFKKIGRYKEALHHYERFRTAVDELNKTEVLQLESELKYKDQLVSQTTQIKNLEYSNLKFGRNLIIWIASLVSLLFLISLYFIQRFKRQNKQLNRKNKEILLAQLDGQNIERKRMAGELHDNLNTKIAAVRWQLEALESTESLNNPELLKKSINQLNDAYEDIRLISHNLMPETVQSMGIINSIADLIEKLNSSDRVKFQFITEASTDVDYGSLAYPVYNLIFEMVNNVMKHANAQNAWISLSRNEQGDLKITVSDDGKGFDVGEMKGGYGLKNIISRVENLHGNYNIESAPGKGTKIYIEIPHL